MGFFRKDRLDPGNGIYPFDPAMPVSPYQRIAVVGGSWRDMGRQYVAQCREGFVARCAAAFADYYGALGDEGRVRGMGRRYLRACERDFPQLIELVDGMAEEAGVAFGDAVLALYGISMLRAERECSEVAAWGGATRDGHLIGASNMDLGYEAREFLPAVLAYPEDGNAFISCELFHRTCLNEKGVLLQGSGHQNAGEGSIRRPTNDDPRHMWNDANVWAAAFADSAAEAMAPYRDWEFVTGCNQLAGDPSHDVWLMEFTGKKKRVRRAGDLGERDYLMENNGSHHPDMQDCINQGAAYWSDTDPRYWTVQKHVEDRWGSLTKRDLFEAESHGDFYVPEGWSRPYRADWGLNVWRRDASQPVPAGWHSNWNPADSGDAAFGDWSPQVHSVDFRPVLRHIVDVEDRAFYCMKAAYRPMMKQKYGRIVAMSSVVGLRGNPGQANYAASKAGLIGMCKSLAKELAGRNVTVNLVAPGFIDTDMTAALPETAREALLATIPMARLGQPEDVARAVGFFAGPDAGYITGQVLCVDGGMAV